MKAIKLFLMGIAISLLSSNSMFAAGKLYIVGDAIFSEWNLGEIPLMYDEGDNVFSFTGYFTADKEFKFIEGTDWSVQQYYNNAGTTGYLDLTSGGNLTTNGTGDPKFKMETSGWYKITCDLANLTITAEAKADDSGQPVRYQALYMVGGATVTDWDLGKSVPLKNQGNRLYSGNVWLKADGSFKFTVAPNKGFDNTYFFFRDVSDNGKISQDATDDRQWSVSETGYYTVTVNLEDASISIVKTDLSLYVIGGAVFGGWESNLAQKMNAVSPNVYAYTGYFKADEEFKFNSQRTLTQTDLQIHNGANETGYISDGSATLLPNVEKTGDDYKFKLAEAGNYTITCNLNTMTVTATKIDYQTSEIHYSALYMVGTATPDNESTDDFPTKAVKLTSNGDNTYSAEEVDLTTGVFKILAANDLGWYTTNFFRDKTENTTISTDGTDDRKWTIPEVGKYNITVNLANWTITIINADGTSSSPQIKAGKEDVYTKDGNIYVSSTESATLRVYSMQGQLLKETKISQKSVINGFHSGIYMLTLSNDTGTKSYKVILK